MNVISSLSGTPVSPNDMYRFRRHGFDVAPINVRKGPEAALDMVNMCVYNLSRPFLRSLLTCLGFVVGTHRFGKLSEHDDWMNLMIATTLFFLFSSRL